MKRLNRGCIRQEGETRSYKVGVFIRDLYRNRNCKEGMGEREFLEWLSGCDSAKTTLVVYQRKIQKPVVVQSTSLDVSAGLLKK